jgi:predicted helicase
MKPGRHLEKLLSLIHETIKDSELTKIYSNRKLSNTAGQLREIDILIETSINGLDIKVAIECKDYKNKVTVEKIEAFNSKCARIPAINKKVLVATSGFQKDAVFAAKDFGIELLDFKKISPSIVLSWMPMNQITGKFEFVLPMRVGLIGAEDIIDNVDLDDNFLIYFQDNRPY